MSVVCALSNEIPDVPVVSPVSGSVFERRLIEKYIREHGTDPVNGEELKEDQLIELKLPTSVKPKPPTFTSIPAILKSLQDEWDSVMLNSFTVRKQLLVARQELNQSLYRYDSACRVIARLNSELTAAREALATLKPQHDLNGDSNQQKRNENGLDNGNDEINDPAFIEKLQANANALTSTRKKRIKKLLENITPANQMKEFKTVNSFTGLHSASTPGLLAVDISVSNDNLLITGGNDKKAIVFDKQSEQIIATLEGHSKKVNSVILHPNSTHAITASSDATIRVWNIQNARSENVLKPHNGPITAISLHPLNDYLLSASTDEQWAFSDINTGKCLLKLGDTTTEYALTAAQFHPDGMILGCGTSDNLIKIWDLKDKTNVANFPGHNAPITALKFSENGYYLATAAANVVKLWDLRHLKEFKAIEPFNNDYNVNEISFDSSGYYMAIAGDDLRIYETKKWENLRVFTDHTANVTDVKFGQNASYIASTGLDRALKIYKYEE